jgi:antitoxin YefM
MSDYKITTTYSQLREQLADVWDRAEESNEPVIVTRRGHRDMAFIPAEELEGLRETAHLLRSPANAIRLFEAISRALRGETEESSPDELRERFKLEGNG